MAINRVQWLRRPVIIHSGRTAVATLASLLVARLFRLSEAYWAPITTIVITQSSLGAALTVSWQRFVGTLVGAALGAIVASYFGPRALVFAACIFVLGILCAALRVDRSAYRFAGVTLAIVLLLPRIAPAWRVAFGRFVEVSIGIGTALVFAKLWPEKEEIPSEGKLISSQPKSGPDQIRAGS
jgi:uncharacterized membrane protein YccC